jgi:hypothetical protein
MHKDDIQMDTVSIWLLVTSGAKHWLLRIVVRGKRRDMGLG